MRHFVKHTVAIAVAICFCIHPCIAQQQSDEQLAAHYFDQRRYEEAAQLYESLYQSSHKKYHYQRLLDALIAAQQYRDAQRLVSQRQRAYPAELSAWVDEGYVLQSQGHERKAEKSFRKALEHITADQQPVADLAAAFQHIGRLDLAALTYLTARSKSNNNTLYLNELASVYAQQGDYTALTNEYFNMLDARPAMMSNVQVSLQQQLQQAPDRRLAEGVKQALVQRVRKDPSNRVYLEMMIWYALQERDFRFALEQAEAVDARFPEQGSEQLMRVAQIARSNSALDVAEEAYALVRRKGAAEPRYVEALVGELDVAYLRVADRKQLTGSELQQLRTRYKAAFDELGRNERTVDLMRHYASLLAYHGGNLQEAISTLDDVLEMKRLRPAQRDEVKLELADLLLFAGQVWDASLLYMQVDRANHDDRLGSTAKFGNARLSYFTHDFAWAMSQLEVLRASTTKLIANDAMELSLLISDNMDDDSTYTTLAPFADADLLLYQGRLDEAWAGFDAVGQMHLSHPIDDEVLMRKATIRTRQGRYAEADSLLERVARFYPDGITAEPALMQRAELNERHLKRPSVALQCYERLLLDYPASLYADQARKRYNQLKEK